MTCRFQCTHCQDVLNVAATVVGKRIRCPLCETVLTVPEPDPARVFLDADLPTQLERFKLTDWDRACARKILEMEMAPPAALRKAILAVRRAAKGGKPPALNEQLLQDGALAKSHNLALTELVKGAVEAAATEKLMECPNCFAAIPAASKACKFCRQKLGDMLLYDMCPNCKKEQPEGQEWCRACGASMATGLMPGVQAPRCPRCSKVIRGDYEVCPKCRTPLNKTKGDIQREAYVRLAKNWWGRYSLAVVGAAVLLLVLYAYAQRQAIKGWFVGKERAALDTRLEALDAALRFNDLAALAGFVDPGTRCPADQRLRTTMLGGLDPAWVVQRIDSLKHPTVTLEATSATVYTQIEGQFDPATVTMPEVTEVTDISKAANKLKTGHLLRAQVPWKWVCRDGVWYYAGPFPK